MVVKAVKLNIDGPEEKRVITGSSILFRAPVMHNWIREHSSNSLPPYACVTRRGTGFPHRHLEAISSATVEKKRDLLQKPVSEMVPKSLTLVTSPRSKSVL